MTGSNKTNPMIGGNVTEITPEKREEDQSLIESLPKQEPVEPSSLGRGREDAPEVD